MASVHGKTEERRRNSLLPLGRPEPKRFCGSSSRRNSDAPQRGRKNSSTVNPMSLMICRSSTGEMSRPG